MASEILDKALVAAKNVLGHGYINMNVETQIRRSDANDAESAIKAIRDVVGSEKMDKVAEGRIRGELTKVESGEGKSQPNPQLKGGLMDNAPKEGVNKSNKDAFEANKLGGGESTVGNPAAAQTQTSSAINSARGPVGPGGTGSL
jgi:hypothetical protein